jgi:hypothetical protein
VIPKYSDIQELSDEKLQQIYDGHAANTVVGTGFYLEELARRKVARESARMLSLTETMGRLTWVVLGVSILNVILVGVQVWLALSASPA